MAHAVVEQIAPDDRQRIDRSPADVQITFSEAIQLLSPTDASVVTATGESVVSGAAQVPAGNSHLITIPLTRNLPPATYTTGPPRRRPGP